MQSLINIMECQLEEAFEAAAAAGGGGASGSRRASQGKRKASVAASSGDGSAGGDTTDPKVQRIYMLQCGPVDKKYLKYVAMKSSLAVLNNEMVA